MFKCAIVIGHTPDAPGAVSHDGVSEFVYNEGLADRILALAAGSTCSVFKVYRDRPNQYTALPNKINTLSPNFIVSLHANAFDTQAHGSEVLYWHTSLAGSELGYEIISQLIRLPHPRRNRGLKALSDGDRGSLLLKRTKAPCVIVEPFFIDNKADWAWAQAHVQQLADALWNAIYAYGTA